MKRKTDSDFMVSYRNRYAVKERIFISYMLFFIFISLLTVILNLLSDLDFSFNYKWIGISLFCMPLTVLAYKKKNVFAVHRIGTWGISIVILPLCWLSSSGLVSPSIIYSLAVLLLINFIITGFERIVLNTLFIIVNMGMIALYRFYPEVYKPMTAEEQFSDWIINVPVIFIFLAVLLTVFERAYEEERRLSDSKTERLELMSRTDPLTGINNRLHLSDDIEACIADFRAEGFPFSIIILDLDFFKNYNDQYGHLKGDDCLKTVSRVLKESVSREGDSLYRYGGEEFLLLLKRTDKDGAEVIAQKVQDALIREAIPHQGSSVSSVVTASMGITTVRNGDSSCSELFGEADKALYFSKGIGRNRVSHIDDIPCFYSGRGLSGSC